MGRRKQKKSHIFCGKLEHNCCSAFHRRWASNRTHGQKIVYKSYWIIFNVLFHKNELDSTERETEAWFIPPACQAWHVYCPVFLRVAFQMKRCPPLTMACGSWGNHVSVTWRSIVEELSQTKSTEAPSSTTSSRTAATTRRLRWTVFFFTSKKDKKHKYLFFRKQLDAANTNLKVLSDVWVYWISATCLTRCAKTSINEFFSAKLKLYMDVERSDTGWG